MGTSAESIVETVTEGGPKTCEQCRVWNSIGKLCEDPIFTGGLRKCRSRLKQLCISQLILDTKGS